MINGDAAGGSLKFDTDPQKSRLIVNAKGSQIPRVSLTGFTLTRVYSSIQHSNLSICDSHQQ
jgi:hypothetical protein